MLYSLNILSWRLSRKVYSFIQPIGYLMYWKVEMWNSLRDVLAAAVFWKLNVHWGQSNPFATDPSFTQPSDRFVCQIYIFLYGVKVCASGAITLIYDPYFCEDPASVFHQKGQAAVKASHVVVLSLRCPLFQVNLYVNKDRRTKGVQPYSMKSLFFSGIFCML